MGRLRFFMPKILLGKGLGYHAALDAKLAEYERAAMGIEIPRASEGAHPVGVNRMPALRTAHDLFFRNMLRSYQKFHSVRSYHSSAHLSRLMCGRRLALVGESGVKRLSAPSAVVGDHFASPRFQRGRVGVCRRLVLKPPSRVNSRPRLMSVTLSDGFSPAATWDGLYPDRKYTPGGLE